MRTKPFMKDELVLIGRRDFEADHISPERLRELTILMREQGSGSRQVVETALRKSGIKLKNVAKIIDLDSTEAIKSAVEIGLGVGFVSRWALSKELELGTLKVVQVSGMRSKETSRWSCERPGPSRPSRRLLCVCAPFRANACQGTTKTFATSPIRLALLIGNQN